MKALTGYVRRPLSGKKIKSGTFKEPGYQIAMKYVITFFICLLGFSHSVYSQNNVQLSGKKLAYSKDTALVNSYVSRLGKLPNIYTKEDIDTAYRYLRKIYSISLSRHYDRGLSEYYRILSTVYNSSFQYDSSLIALQKELYWAQRSEDPMELAETYAAMAIRHEYLSELDSAAKYYIKAVHISDSLKNFHISGSIYNNLSIIFYNIGDYKNAMKYAKAGYQTGRKLNDSTIFISCLINMAGIKKDLNHQYDTALVLYEQVRGIVKNSVKYQSQAYNSLVNEGDILNMKKQYQKALSKYALVLDAKGKTGPYITSYVYSGMGNTYYNMKRYIDADRYINMAVRIEKDIQARQELSNSYDLLSEIKEAQGHFQPALVYRKKHDSLQDVLTSEANRKNMHTLELKYQTAQKDKQIAQQELALTRNQRDIERKNAWILIFIAGTVALVIILFLLIRSYQHRKKLHEQKLITIQKENEVATLRAGMDAREEERNRISREMHDDIGSALTTILYLSDEMKDHSEDHNKSLASRISGTTGKLVDKMNEIIWSMNREYDTLDDLIAYTRQHAADFLETYGIEYHFDIPDPMPNIRLQGEQRRNIFLVLKECLNNTVKHAQATRVQIAFLIDEQLQIKICDDGKGVDTGHLRRFGNGLRNMKQRMESVGGSFEIKNNNGTEVSIKCPL